MTDRLKDWWYRRTHNRGRHNWRSYGNPDGRLWCAYKPCGKRIP